jgi:glycine hydroxymethyltransferase
MVMCKEEYAKALDKAIFPGIQGGPLMHIIAAKAVAFKEAQSKQFKQDQEQTVKNAKMLSESLIERDFNIVSGGTDNHVMLLNLNKFNITGKEAEPAMSKAGIILNKNTIPFETKSPFITSGIRIGTPASTTRGMKEREMVDIAAFIENVIANIGNDKILMEISSDVEQLVSRFPIYK